MAAPSTSLDILEDYEDFKLVVYKSDSANNKCPIQRKAIGTSKLVITSGSFAHCLTTRENLKIRALWTNDPDARRILSIYDKMEPQCAHLIISCLIGYA
jgi:hypothetical protein